jgi:hypothetical protein
VPGTLTSRVTSWASRQPPSRARECKHMPRPGASSSAALLRSRPAAVSRRKDSTAAGVGLVVTANLAARVMTAVTAMASMCSSPCVTREASSPRLAAARSSAVSRWLRSFSMSLLPAAGSC